MTNLMPLAGGGAASLLACICMFGACHANVEYCCVCSLAALATKFNGIPLIGIPLNEVLFMFPFAYHTYGILQAI